MTLIRSLTTKFPALSIFRMKPFLNPYMSLTFIATAFAVFSCTTEDPIDRPCADGNVEIRELSNLRYFQNINERDTIVNLIINSQSDYEKYFQEQLTPVDFDKNTMLAGRYLATSGDFVFNQEVFQDCSNKEIQYIVKLTKGGAAAITRVPYVVLVPKVPVDFKVNFDVSYKP